MVHIQDGIVGLSTAPLTAVLVTQKYILTHIPEAELWTFLVRLSLNFRVTYFLNVELRYLESGSANW